jgi:sulfate adenylyltransferase subunit 1
MAEENFKLRKKYIVKHTSNHVKSMATEINFKLNINTYEKETSSELSLNDIANVNFKLLKPIMADLYEDNRITGSFILIDEVSNNTVAAGMITGFLD